ncbi:MAG TPA: TonB-dependent receptor, partial [Longimicrobiales bacterium]|nr:TonB-dependent receptor [Longimicrobiales bacterium]
YTLNLLEDQDPFRTAQQRSMGLSVRGGTDDLTYFISGNWDDNEGVLPNNFDERWNVRGNFRMTPRDWLDITVSTSYTDGLSGLPDNDNNISGYIPIALVSFPWTQPVTVDGVRTCPLNVETARLTGDPLEDLGFDGCAENPGFGGRTFEDIATRRNELDVGRFIGSASFTVRPLDVWSARFTVGYDQANILRRNIVPVDPSRPFGDQSDGFIFRDQTTSQNLTLEGSTQLALDITPEISSVSTVGGQFFEETLDGQTATGREFPAGSPSVANSVVNESDDSFTSVRTLGVFIQQQFGWRDRLFIAPAIRLDDNSSFGEELGIQDLKKINASWVMSEEEWFPGFFQTFRLRGAWGESAKQPGTNDALSLLTPVPVVVGGEERLGVLPDRPGNPELKPETGKEFEAGFDATVLDGRLGVQFTYYDQTTKDAIVARDLAPSLGFPGQQITNVGELTNSGIELGVEFGAIQRPDIQWDLSAQLTTTKSKITDLPEPIIFDFGNDSNAGQRHQEGLSFAAYVWRPVTLDADGNPVVADEAVEVGQPTPRWEGSVQSRVTFLENFTLSALLDFQGGFQMANNNRSFLCNLLGGGTYGGTCPDLFEKGPDGEPTDEARIKAFAASIGNEYPWIEDADFAKLR